MASLYSYKYLGVIISNLSWSLHIQSICCKSRKLIIGLLFRHFYSHSSPSVLYNTLVRPHLEYCSCLWDPSSSASISSLEFFALKLCSKNWSSSYFISLTVLSFLFVVGTLNSSFFIKFLMVMSSFLLILFSSQPSPYMSTRSFHPNNLLVPFART